MIWFVKTSDMIRCDMIRCEIICWHMCHFLNDRAAKPHVSPITHWYVCNNSFIYVTWHIHVCHEHTDRTAPPGLSFCHDSSICVVWHVIIYATNSPTGQRPVCVSVPWLIQICAMSYLHVCRELTYRTAPRCPTTYKSSVWRVIIYKLLNM